MVVASESCPGRRCRPAITACLMVLLGFPLSSVGATLNLSKDGPRTAREGDLIEYSLEVVNEGTVNVAGVSVLDTLPAEVQFVQATPTPGGTYNSITGVWTLPTLGTNAGDRSAGLQIQALVNQNLINNPADVVAVVNRAAVTAPLEQTPLEAQVSTNIICTSCIDWEIESVGFDWEIGDSDWNYDQWEVDLRFYLRVKVANNGPVTSEASVRVTRFEVRGVGLGSVTLFPNGPVAVTLDPGQTRTIEFKSSWEEADDFDFTALWEVEIRDVALLDPVLPNTASGSYYNEDDDDDSDYNASCVISTAAYGSHLAPRIARLREFRDRHLLTNPFGRWFVELYYRHSPYMANYIRGRETLRTIVRSILALTVFSIEYPIVTGLVLLLPPLVIAARRRKR